MVQNPVHALALLTREKFAGVYVTAKFFREAFEIGKLLQNEQILEGMPDGVVLLEGDNTILWGNGRLRQWSGRESVLGVNFFAALGSPEILGPDFCPFHTALATGQSTSSTLRSQDDRYFQVHAAPVRELDGPPRHLIVTVRDVTHEVQQQQKLAAIHQAGMELADLTPEELFHMPVKDRIELLKVQHPALHQGPAELRGGRGPPAGPEDQPPGAAVGRGHGPPRRPTACSTPCRRTTA